MCLSQCQTKEGEKKRGYRKFNFDTNFDSYRQFCQGKENENLLYKIISAIHFRKYSFQCFFSGLGTGLMGKDVSNSFQVQRGEGLVFNPPGIIKELNTF